MPDLEEVVPDLGGIDGTVSRKAMLASKGLHGCNRMTRPGMASRSVAWHERGDALLQSHKARLTFQGF